jgi:DNA helicase II / ATP-dependent DNA helicase PcrA
MPDLEYNLEQQAALEAIDGTWVVVASPGSGKTTILLGRHWNMLKRNISDRDVLNLTFTRAAAEEMVRRAGLLNAEKIFRTFHSFALDIAKKERRNFGFPLIDTVIPVRGEDYKLIFDLCRRYGIQNYEDLKEKISGWKRTNIDPQKAIEEAEKMPSKLAQKFFPLALAYEQYEVICRRQGWLDYDSLMREVVKLFETNATAKARHQKKYIAVDEAQDTDIVQFNLLKLIFGENIFVVGDENQLIYEWRSAQPGNLTNFERLFPGAQKLYLGENFRSTGALVEFFREILPVDNGIASRMLTRNPRGIREDYTRFFDEFTEAHTVLNSIIKSGEPEKSTILARTNRQLFVFQRVCAARGIKYNFLGKKDFFDQKEVKALLVHAAEKKDDPRPAHEVFKEIIEKEKMIEYFKERGRISDDSDPVNNLNGIVKIAANKGTMGEFLEYVRKLTRGRRDVKRVKTLTLSTVHQAKGREWDNVYVIGANMGKMPHSEGDPMEEKRIYYVACTRAAKTLHVSFNEEPGIFVLPYRDRIKVYTGLEDEDGSLSV